MCPHALFSQAQSHIILLIAFLNVSRSIVSMNVHRIPTKLGTEIRLNEPFNCAKLQHDWSTYSCFMADFAKCAKISRRKKTKKKTPTLGRSYLGDG